MRVVSALLRFFAFLYHGLLALVLFVLGALITLAGGAQSVRLDMLPWTGPTSVYVMLFGGLIGLFIVILAIRRRFRGLFFLWALVVAFHLIRGYFLGGYRFTPAEFQNVIYLSLGSLIALLGAFIQMFGHRKRH